jgi:hypothetical protein
LKLENGFMTGCDSKTEWQLPWFIHNFKKHNSEHLLVVDFGMSKEMAMWAANHADSLADMSTAKAKGWFLKPIAMMNSPFKKTVWIDTDCEVLSNIESIFELLAPDKLNMVLDRPWSKKFDTTMYNSGIVGFHNKPGILAKWASGIDPTVHRGDQEALHALLDDLQRMVFINELPHKYNVLRLDHLSGTAPANRLVNHWTGTKGNQHIRSLIDE